jgi:CRISPR-associated protein Cas1
MEPFRPYVDQIVLEIMSQEDEIDELTPDLKRKLLGIATIDIELGNQTSPLMVGMQRTTASLMKCFEGKAKKVLYPEIRA